MKKIIIYTSDDEIISYRIVKKIINYKKLKNYKFDIILSKPSFLRKIKVILVIILSGSIFKFLNLYKKRIKKNEISKNKIRFITKTQKNYVFGISINYLKKIKLQKYKIYNFHLGNLKYQRGSFIFFYKYLKNWKNIFLTLHIIKKDFDKGKIVNEKKINLSRKTTPVDIIDLYNNNSKFIYNSINQIFRKRKKLKIYSEYDQLHYVPSITKIIINYLRLAMNNR